MEGITRIWGYADPRMLNTNDLLVEHRNIHELSKRDSAAGDEHDRFWASPYSLSCLLLRHELIREECDNRWKGHHSRKDHPTPVVWRKMLPEHKQLYVTYAVRIRRWHKRRKRSITVKERVAEQRWFERRMKDLAFPKQGIDNPWDFRGVPLVDYITVGDDWKEQRKWAKRRKWKSGRRT